jgi:large subunit ribosomal protein L21
MYAIIETGGKQYRVREGDRVKVEKLAGTIGEKIRFDRVLLIGGTADAPKVGRPVVDGAAVEGEILPQRVAGGDPSPVGKGRKIVVYKFKRRKNYRRKAGHRQQFTELRITAIRPGA